MIRGMLDGMPLSVAVVDGRVVGSCMMLDGMIWDVNVLVAVGSMV